MALTSGEYEAQANRLRSQMDQTVGQLRSNLMTSKLASEAAWTCPAFVESVLKFTRPASRTEAG